MRHPSLPDPDLTTTSGSVSESEGAEAIRPEEQARELSLRYPGLPNSDLTAASASESESEEESEGVEAETPEEQVGGDHRQEVDIAARSHEEGALRQALELSLRYSCLPYPDLAATSESESESEPFCARSWSGPLCHVLCGTLSLVLKALCFMYMGGASG